jgi:hypothetical protein
MLLRYVTWMQRGIKQASDSYARFMASIGSLERVVELHDRGAFNDAAEQKLWEAEPVVTQQQPPLPGAGPGDGFKARPQNQQGAWTAGGHSTDGNEGGDLHEPLLQPEDCDLEQQAESEWKWSSLVPSWYTTLLRQPNQWKSWFLGGGPYPEKVGNMSSELCHSLTFSPGLSWG